MHAYSLVSQETFTQTSKTIFEIAQINDTKCTNTDTIQTQTSRMSVVENKTIEYRIKVTGSHTRFTRHEVLQDPLEDDGWPAHHQLWCESDQASSVTLRMTDDAPTSKYSEQLEPSDETSDNADTSRYDTDFTDSLEDHTNHGGQGDISDRSVPQSVDRDLEELYNKLENSFDLRSYNKPEAFGPSRYIALSPLTEETAKDSAVSWKDIIRTKPKENLNKKDIQKFEIQVKDENRGQFKLPPIQRSLSPSPQWRLCGPDRWDSHTPGLAAGESARVTVKPSSPRLPYIRTSRGDGAPPARASQEQRETISITNKIEQLKLPAGKKHAYSYATESRSSSPGGARSAAGAAVMTRGADALCADVLARLRQACSCAKMTFEQHVSAARYESSDSCGAKWLEAVEVLEDIPTLFRGFWGAVSEQRVADLLRLVTAQVESPRTRVARAACATLAAVLEHTSYTKKPEFNEAVSTLLLKTGSCMAPVRRAANVALDSVAAGVPLSATVPALCAGVEHKSPLVRCATARLLVVSAALARGGRELLRARPPTAAAARRHALRALSALLHDRNQDTRKYAERLYVMLRPLDGFEAYFLCDVDARTACKQMKKFDPLVRQLPGSPR